MSFGDFVKKAAGAGVLVAGGVALARLSPSSVTALTEGFKAFLKDPKTLLTVLKGGGATALEKTAALQSKGLSALADSGHTIARERVRRATSFLGVDPARLGRYAKNLKQTNG